ncbi:MAG: hypothetical protein GY953_55935, partial [bacterium]|nr:hypothetical protein [bacterium]
YITTQDAEPGDYIYLRTASPISANGRIVVPVDSHLQGVVAHSKRAGRGRGEAVLTIRLETLTLPDGKVLELTPRFEFDAETMAEPARYGRREVAPVFLGASLGTSAGYAAARNLRGVGIGAGVGGAVGLATVLLRRGPEVVLYQGVSMDVVIDKPVTLR